MVLLKLCGLLTKAIDKQLLLKFKGPTAVLTMQNEAKAIRAKIWDSLMVLYMGSTVSARKQSVLQNQASKCEIVEEVAYSRAVVMECLEAMQRRATQERKAENEARLAEDLRRQDTEASFGSRLSRVEELINQEATAQAQIRADAQTSTESTPAKIGIVKAVLMRLSAPFKRLAEEDAKVQQVSSPNS